MAGKGKKKKKGKGQEGGGGANEELLKHPIMANPPFTPVMATVAEGPILDEPKRDAKQVGSFREKEILPVIYAEGPWLMTVCRYEEAWIHASWVEELDQDQPDSYFKDQQVIHDTYEEYAPQAEEGEPIKTETTPYYEQAEGYGMLVYPNTLEEMFVQSYAEMVYAYEPNAEMMGTYKHIMEVFSPDSIVELEDYVFIPAEIDDRDEQIPPTFPEELKKQGGGKQSASGQEGEGKKKEEEEGIQNPFMP